MFDETKYVLSHGSADNAIVKFITVARNGRLFPVHTREELTPLVSCSVNDSLVHVHTKRPANAYSVRQCCAAESDALVAGCHPIS